MKVAIVYGTRPELIKLAPVYMACKARGLEVDLLCSGQHQELLVPLYEVFKLKVTAELGAMRAGQTLNDLTGNLCVALGEAYRRGKYDYVLVQGDTTTAFVGALAAFYEKIPVGHVEAGLRTHMRYSPFPEEANRKLVGVLAQDHFPPTNRARDNLLREAMDPARILVTGNTVIDALRFVSDHYEHEFQSTLQQLGLVGSRYVLMTTHRRESIGAPMKEVLRAVKEFLAAHRDVRLVLPMHRNPAVRETVLSLLSAENQVMLIEAQSYLAFCALMKSSMFIVTDSGGIQEEAPYFNKRTLVIREATERPEAVEAGTALLVGTDFEKVNSAMNTAYDEAVSGRVPNLALLNPFGDGLASGRIVEKIVA